MKDVYRLGAIAIALLAAFGIAAAIYSRSQDQERSEQVRKQATSDPAVFVRPHSRFIGPADAEVTVVEFFDPECEACRKAHAPVKQLISGYSGRVRLVMRYMPYHPNSVYAAGALEAAGAQDRYWEMLDTLFEHQPAWGDHHAPKPELIPGYAREIGLDMNAFVQSIESGTHKRLVATDRIDGERLGVSGTPSFFVNQKPLVRLSLVDLKKMIDSELAAN
ncbi:MAG: thioredoxin domain-containing protein [bacterium]|nr:thioredoxin domain-containing protein [bacterium]